MAEILSQEEINKLLGDTNKKENTEKADDEEAKLLEALEKSEKKINDAQENINKTEKALLEATEALKNLTTQENKSNTNWNITNEEIEKRILEEKSKIEPEEQASKEDTVKKESNKKLWDKKTAEEIKFEENPKDDIEKESFLSDQGEDITDIKETKESFEKLPEESKEKIENFFKSKENELNKKMEASKIPPGIWEKTKEYWKAVDKKEAGKAAGKIVFLSALTLGLGAYLGIAPTSLGSNALKTGLKGLTAAGLNMSVSSNLTGDFSNAFKKMFGASLEKKEKEGWKKNFGVGDVASITGIAAAFVLSGGIGGAIAVVGYGSRKTANIAIDYHIKKLEDKGLTQAAKKWKHIKGISNGVLTIVTGLGTMAAAHSHENEIQAKNNNHSTEAKTPENVQNGNKNTITDNQKIQIEKNKILEQYKTKEATVKEGEGYQNSFIRQIEGDKELAVKLGFKGDINDTKALHEFAGKEAHIISMKTGIVGEGGKEAWITEKNKIAPIIKMENGKIVVEIKNIENGEQIETLHEGDKFGENLNKYEYNHTNKQETIHTEKNTFDDTHTEEKPYNEQEEIMKHLDSSNYKDLANHVETTSGHKVIEYDDTSKNEIKIDEANITKNIFGKEYTALTWTKAPENIYHINLDQFKEMNEIHQGNIQHLFSDNNLNSAERAELTSILKEDNAIDILKYKPEDLKAAYRPLVEYMDKLHKITGLEPIEGTRLTPAETVENYFYRNLMKVAELKKLGELKLSK